MSFLEGRLLICSPFQTEYRRRLWSYLYHADKLYVTFHAVDRPDADDFLAIGQARDVACLVNFANFR